MKTVKEARQGGLKVKVTHNRTTELKKLYLEDAPTLHNFAKIVEDWDFKVFFNALNNFGGSTVVEVLNPKTNKTAVGVARCHESDQYNKKVGVKIALERALKKLNS